MRGINDVINVLTGEGIKKSRMSYKFYDRCVSSKTLVYINAFGFALNLNTAVVIVPEKRFKN